MNTVILLKFCYCYFNAATFSWQVSNEINYLVLLIHLIFLPWSKLRELNKISDKSILFSYIIHTNINGKVKTLSLSNESKM